MGLDIVGLGIAGLSSFFNGSFPAWQRCAGKSDPVLFNGIVCFGAFLSSLPVPFIAGKPYVFTLWGALGGALFVFAVLFSFVAMSKAGLAISQAVWSTSAILVSFTWGAFGPSQIAAPVRSLPLSFVAIALLTVGALIIVRSDDIADRTARVFRDQTEDKRSPYEAPSYDAVESAAEKSSEIGSSEDDKGTAKRFAGLLFALAVGVFGGSILVPFKFIPVEKSGLAALPSFGVGALLGTAVAVFRAQESGWPGQATMIAGVMSGATWNAGNICSIVAQSPPFSLPYGIAYPILQCAMLFGGIWGIVVFREIRGGAILSFWVGAAVLVTGVVVLAMYGPGSSG